MSSSACLVRLYFTKSTRFPILAHNRTSTTLCAAPYSPPSTTTTSAFPALAQRDQICHHQQSQVSTRTKRKVRHTYSGFCAESGARLHMSKKKLHAPQATLNSDNMTRGRSHPTRPNPEAPWEGKQQKQQPHRTIYRAKPAPVATSISSDQPRPPPATTTATKPTKNKVEEQARRNAPSQASGGIPEPTPAYLKSAAREPKTLSHPRKLLVVIDLNGTLLHRPNKRHPSRFVERPHARDFLAYCIDVFHVVIWSSAKPFNVASMANQLLTSEQRSKVVAIWARDRFGLTQADFDSHTQCYKRLHVLWNDPVVAASHPDAKNNKRWSQEDTVLIDDSLEKGRSEPHNLIEIPEFSSDNPEIADILPQVHDYINACASQENVSSFMRERPFKAMPTSQLLQGMAHGLEG